MLNTSTELLVEVIIIIIRVIKVSVTNFFLNEIFIESYTFVNEKTQNKSTSTLSWPR
jgi:hypothetical protein